MIICGLAHFNGPGPGILTLDRMKYFHMEILGCTRVGSRLGRAIGIQFLLTAQIMIKLHTFFCCRLSGCVVKLYYNFSIARTVCLGALQRKKTSSNTVLCFSISRSRLLHEQVPSVDSLRNESSCSTREHRKDGQTKIPPPKMVRLKCLLPFCQLVIVLSFL